MNTYNYKSFDGIETIIINNPIYTNELNEALNNTNITLYTKIQLNDLSRLVSLRSVEDKPSYQILLGGRFKR